MLKRKNCPQLTQTCRHSHPHRSQRELRYATYKKFVLELISFSTDGNEVLLRFPSSCTFIYIILLVGFVFLRRRS